MVKWANKNSALSGRQSTKGETMSEIKTGGPAFPGYGEPGMTLRDYFAAKAITGICNDGLPDSSFCKYAAERAYEMADAMIKAREAK
jgi:hypothetical protein